MRLAFVGTGFVADYYMTTLSNHPDLELSGVWDSNAARLKQFGEYHAVRTYGSLEDVLSDGNVETVAVLTTPETHYEIARAVLAAGKNVYCEKPLAMEFADAQALVEQAKQAGLVLAGAPANARSDAFGATRKALEKGAIGQPKLIYAEMEDGPVFRQNWQEWRSLSGAPWPGKHEFEIGCTLEHAGYALSWLIGLFGSIRRITGQSGTFFENKGVDISPDKMGPDFSSACLEFDSGVVARLTCGLCAPRDRSLTIMGSDGTLTVRDLWDNCSAIHLEKPGEKPSLPFRIARRIEARLGKALPLCLPAGKRLDYARTANSGGLPSYPSQIDFCAGIQAIADCRSGRSGAAEDLAAQALHVTEAALALNSLPSHGGRYEMISRV